MTPKKQNPIIEDSSQITVNRTCELSNKLALLPKKDLVLLRRIYDHPKDVKAREVIRKALLDEFSIQELRIALAALDGAHELPLSEKPLGFETAKTWQPRNADPILPPQRIQTPNSESPPLPSAKAAQEISAILTRMSSDDSQWLLDHFGKPRDLRSRLIIIKYRLYRFNWLDVAATLATLQRTLTSD